MTRLLLSLFLLSPAASAAPFRGENCAACHSSVRDGKRPAPAAAAEDAGRYEVIVLGGGLSGLTAAHFLKDRRVLVLEKEDRPGGKTRRERLGGWRFPTGAVYTGKPYGAVERLFQETGLAIRRFRAPIHDYRLPDGRIVREWISRDGFAAMARGEAEKAELARFWEGLESFEKAGKLTLPIEDSDPKLLAELDAQSFRDYLLKTYGPRAAELGDEHARDVFGAGAAEVSAAVGLLYMGSELTDAYSWPGGLGEIAETLAKELGPSVRTGASIELVTQSSAAVTVLFREGGKLKRAEARAAVVALPSNVGRRLIADLPLEKLRAMSAVRYSIYTVMPMRLKRPVYRDSFVLWTPGMAFADLTFAGGERLEGPAPEAPGQLAVAYLPMGAGDERRKLLSATDAEIRRAVLRDLAKVLPEAPSLVEESRVIRWGHAMPVIAPGHFTKVAPKLRETFGLLHFAGVDTQVPAIEGAIHAGFTAAESVRKALAAR